MSECPNEACRLCGSTNFATEIRNIRDWEYGVEGKWDLLRCAECGLVQLSPFPDIELLKGAYGTDYHGCVDGAVHNSLIQWLTALNNSRLRKWISSVVPKNSRVLDVGCGNGSFLSLVREECNAEVVGVDFSETAVNRLKDRGIKSFFGLFLDLPESFGQFDVIFMNNYLEHTILPREEIKQARRLLKHGGKILGEVPNYDSYDRMVGGRFWGGGHAPRHVFHFERTTLLRLLDEGGFGGIKFSTPLHPSHWALTVQNRFAHLPMSRMKNGRAWYYGLLVLGFVPVSALSNVLGHGTMIDFSATPVGQATSN